MLLIIILLPVFYISSNFLINEKKVTKNEIDLQAAKNSIDDFKSSFKLNSKINTEKNFIIKYKSAKEKLRLLDIINTLHGQVTNDLAYLAFLIFNLPYDSIPILYKLKLPVYEDKLIKVLNEPKNLLGASQTVNQDLGSYKAPIQLINGTQLIDGGYKGQGIKIAILDTGIDSTHPDLSNVVYQKSFVTKQNGYSSDEDPRDGHAHGTHVAGIAAGTGVASKGKYIGVASEAKLYSMKVVSQFGFATTKATLLGIEDAINQRVNIISMSLGFEASNPDHPISLALDEAVNNYGIHVTVSAGNSGPGKNTISTPAAARSVITVGASYTTNKSATFFSSRGVNSDYRYDPDIIAPGYEIISSLAHLGLLELSESYYTPSQVISGTGGDYLPLSGTSMSAPVVAGAIAVLLSKYPGTSPFALRSALMSAADNNGQQEYVQGSGFINLGEAASLLGKTTETQVALLPQRSIFPDNPVLIPNQELRVVLQVTSGVDSSVTVTVPNSTLAQYITFDSTLDSFNKSMAGYYGEIPLVFKTGLVPTPGIYTGEVKITTSIRNYTLNVGPISVEIPKQRIAWNIWYTDSPDSTEGNYLSLKESLEEQNIYLVDIDQPISASWLFEYKTVVFPDIEAGISNQAFGILNNFVTQGGTVVILSSFYPFTNIDNLNTFTSQYGQTFEKVLDMSVKDKGVTTNLNFISNMTLNFPANGHWIFNLTQPLSWFGGSHINVMSPASTVVSINNSKPVIAGFFGNQTVKGKVFTLSSEYFFYNQFFGQVERKFASQFFSLLSNEKANDPFIYLVNGNRTLKVGDTWKASVYLGEKEFNSTTQYQVSITLPNKSITSLTPQLNPTNDGTLLSYAPNQNGLYTVELNYNGNSKSTQFLVYDTDISYNLTILAERPSLDIPYYLEDSDITIVNSGDTVTIGLNVNVTTSLTPKVIVTNIPEIANLFTSTLIDMETVKTFELDLVSSLNSTYYEGSFTTIGSEFYSGYYSVEVISFGGSNDNFKGNPISEFYIISPDPEIDLNNSFLNDRTLKFYDAPNSSTAIPEVLSVKAGASLSLSIQATKGVNDGTDVFVLFVPFYPFIVSRMIIDVWKLERSGNKFIGDIVLPSNSSLMVDDRMVNFAGNNLITAILIVLRDKQGNYDISAVISTLSISLFASFGLDPALVFLVLVVIPGLIILIYYIRGRNRKKDLASKEINFSELMLNKATMQVQHSMEPPSEEQINLQLHYCPYCGSKVSSGENFCMECGKKL